MRRLPFLLPVAASLALLATPLRSADTATYELDISGPEKPVRRGHLDLGGTGPAGRSIEANSYYIEVDGKPYIPVVGEFHFSRTPASEWESSLRKIKAGGVNTVATYVFWNLHERTQGHFDWTGDLDLRRFVRTVQQAGLNMILRVGPFAHGEIRNGGLPDWLYGLPLEVRSNDPAYLALADKLYGQIGLQVRGLLFKDGGPIIGIQLENEYQHSAAPWDIRYAGSPITRTVAGRDVAVTHEGVSVSEIRNAHAAYGAEHMATLKRLAKKNGLDAPLYTATGWGNAAIVKRGSLPVTAAYAYPFWTPTPRPSPFYLFTDLQKNPDYSPVSFETDLYPSLPAELGAGISITYARRSFVPEESVAPMIVRVLGSGSNGVGYYMYHGGATPSFDGVFYNEDAGGLPKINYDYQAPLGQYGQSRAHYFELRPLHLFLASFGDRLAPLPTLLPQRSSPPQPTDTETLRYAARAARGAGFVFLLNFQDHVAVHDQAGIRLQLRNGTETISIPSRGTFVLKQNAHAILPVNLDLDGTRLRSATVQPLTILSRAGGRHFVFFSIDGLPPELVFNKVEISDLQNGTVSRDEDGATVVRGPSDQCFSFVADGRRILVVPAGWAERASLAPDNRLLFTTATVTTTGSDVSLFSFGQTAQDVQIYPGSALPPTVEGARVVSLAAPHPGISAFRIEFPTASHSVDWQQLAENRFVARFNKDSGDLRNVYLEIPYVGDTGMAFINGQLVDDHFYSGRPWQIGLERFLPQLKKDGEMVFVFQPMLPNATYLQDIPDAFRPKFGASEKGRLTVDRPRLIPEYRASLRFDAN